MNTRIRILAVMIGVVTPSLVFAQTEPAPAAPAAPAVAAPAAAVPTPAKAADKAPAQPVSAPETIMFSIDELTEIRSRASVGDSGDQGNAPGSGIENASLYLSTIMYYGPNDWTIWVNGVPIGPGQDFQSFQVGQIGPRFVELMVPLSAMGMRPVRLSPNQTFVVKTGAIVEGAWR